jgi:hypothetical protein
MDSRPRKTTLETFNEELAILDRPLENDVEYIDERPPRRQAWQGMSAIVISTALVACAAVLFFSHPDPDTIIAAAQAAAATAPTPPLPPPPAPEAPAVAATAIAPPPPAAPVASEPSAESAKWRQPPPRNAWAKLRLRSPALPTQ